MIEGFFKITQDYQMRDLTLKKSDLIELNDDDQILYRIAEKD